MSINRFLVAVCLIASSLAPLPATARSDRDDHTSRRRTAVRAPKVGCEACLVVADTGEELWSRRADMELPNASTTKMMTAILVADSGATGDVGVSEDAASTGGGGLDLSAGQAWPVDSLLAALLLSSSNDAAVALAEHVAGSEGAFVASMNQRASAMGLDHTRFVTPHGLDAPGHYSSAADLAAIAKVLLEDPRLLRMVGATQISVEGPEGRVLIENRNLLLDSYPGAIGVKTGYTLGAGNALVSAARRRGRTLIAVVLRADDSFADSAALLDYGFARLRRTVLLGAREPVGDIVLDPAGAVRAVTARASRGFALPDTVGFSFEEAADFELPIARGEVVGRVAVTSEGRVIDRLDAVAGGELASGHPSWAARGLATVLSWGQWIADPTG
ncbi:MAG: D-alanyl-D-alanine carboxypeptidase [Actinomycetota bacterium]|nr:D-alanyl-D-alanine carboxypeptidase [Actinomycetota bacterium]